MPRSNRPRRERRGPEDDESGLDRMMSGWARTETRRGRAFTVQPIGVSAAIKEYVCPGCAQTIQPGIAHVVVWRADGVLGDEADLAARRHWHNHCWRVA